jgi:hypothetical protein
MTLRYACAKCARIITDWRASVLPDGRLELVAHCHGERHVIRQFLDLQGIAFHDGSVLDLQTRDPDEYVKQAREGSGGSGADG